MAALLTTSLTWFDHTREAGSPWLLSSALVADLQEPVDEQETEGHQVPRLSRRAAAALLGLAIDLAPLRTSRDFRVLWIGELISPVGAQITVVALPFQVFVLTH